MKEFVCKACGKVSYSSAPLECQKHPDCPYCGAPTIEEATDAQEN